MKHMNRGGHRRRGVALGERGHSLVEFALTATVFFMTIFGIASMGLAVWRFNIVADLAQEGARYAVVHGKSTSAPKDAAQVETYVQSRSLGIDVTVTTTPPPSTLDAGATVTVNVRHVFTPIGFVRSGTLTLQSTAKMIVAR